MTMIFMEGAQRWDMVEIGESIWGVNMNNSGVNTGEIGVSIWVFILGVYICVSLVCQ